MANADPLDDFFKKIDRKGNKHKKQATLLTNNEELHKQLVIVTSATTAFKENMDLDEEDEEYGNQLIEPSNEIIHPIDNNQGIAAANNKSKTTNKLSVQDNNNNNYGDQQMAADEWEDFQQSNAQYEKLRLKFANAANGGENDDEIYSDDENYLNHDQIDGNENRRREQQDKPVWKLEQIQQTSTNEQSTEKSVEPTTVTEPVKPATTGAYRPPQLRSNSAVTIVSGTSQRISKKEKPNLASTEEFPTLGAGLQKK